MIFQYGLEPVLMQRILIDFEAMESFMRVLLKRQQLKSLQGVNTTDNGYRITG